MSESLKNKIIIVTGTTGTLGAGVVPRLLHAGAIVEGLYRNDEEKTRLFSTLPAEHHNQIHVSRLDQLDRPAVEKFVADVVSRHDRIDGLVNITGGWHTVPFASMTWEQWQAQMDINLNTCWIMTRAVVPTMIKQNYGRIVSFGARAAMQAAPEVAHYVASKVGVAWLMESIANEYKQTGITANTILPSSILSATNPNGVPADDIANAVIYLLSPESQATSGAKIPVYGKG